MITRDRVTEQVAQLWCLPAHGNKEMDVCFAEDIIRLVLQVAEEARREGMIRVTAMVRNYAAAHPDIRCTVLADVISADIQEELNQ